MYTCIYMLSNRHKYLKYKKKIYKFKKFNGRKLYKKTANGNINEFYNFHINELL